MPFPRAVEDERLNPAGRQQGPDQVANIGQDDAKSVGEWLADGEDHLKYAHHHDQEEKRSPNAVQQDVVDLACALNRKRRTVAGAAAELRGPVVRARCIAQDGQSQRLGAGAVGLLMKKERHGIEARSAYGADLGDGRAQFAGQLEGVDVSATSLHQVAHVEQYQGRQSKGEHRGGQHQLAGKVQGIEHQQHRIRLGRAGHFAAQHVDRDTGVFRIWI